MEYGSDILAEFKAGVSMTEGVSGRKPIHTRFDNTYESRIQHPRSENSDDEIAYEKPTPFTYSY